ncbi:B-box domain protein 31, partial [Mucuna pruriens]
MKKCELCNSPAKLFCESDQASLCWECDAKVHTANFLVTKHPRILLCHVCQSLTAWHGTGPKFVPTISVCNTCVNNNSETCSQHNHDEDDNDEDDDEDHDHDGDHVQNDDGVVAEDDEENQVVPWTSTPPPPASTSSNSVATSSTRFSNVEEVFTSNKGRNRRAFNLLF